MVNNSKHKQFTCVIKVNRSARAYWGGYACDLIAWASTPDVLATDLMRSIGGDCWLLATLQKLISF